MQHKTIAANSIFAAALLFFVFGSGFVLLRFLPHDTARVVAMSAIGLIFAGLFIWLLVTRLVKIHGGDEKVRRHLIVMLVNLVLTVAAFAAAYEVLGIVDTTGPEPVITHNYWEALYYSTVTMTTLGYGDMHPTVQTRFLAAVQAFVGYIVLGLMASTLGTLLQRRGETQPAES
jgi:hypothetical protein